MFYPFSKSIFNYYHYWYTQRYSQAPNQGKINGVWYSCGSVPGQKWNSQAVLIGHKNLGMLWGLNRALNVITGVNVWVICLCFEPKNWDGIRSCTWPFKNHSCLVCVASNGMSCMVFTCLSKQTEASAFLAGWNCCLVTAAQSAKHSLDCVHFTSAKVRTI